MADVKISGLPASTVPLDGTEVLPVVQGTTTKKVAVSDLTAGRAVSANSFTPSSSTIPTNGMYLDATNSVSIAANSLKSVTFRQGGISGLGTTPLAWYVPGDIISAQQIGANAAVFSLFGNQAIFSSNYYLKTGTGNDTYINTGVATRYIQEAGGHFWDNAASGTADTTVAFTRLLSLPSTGNLKVEIGNLVIGTAGKGIDFSATAGTGTSELLNDYEEGTWTPIATPASGSLTATYQGAFYTKVGNMVVAHGYLNVSGISSPSGDLTIGGLPYSVKSFQAVVLTFFGGGLTTAVGGYANQNTTTITVTNFNSSSIGTGANLMFTATYTVA